MHPLKKKYIVLAIMLPFLFLFAVLAQAQIQKEIILCMQKGNSKQLALYFNQTVELAVLDNINVYSKAQAQQIIGKFFNDNTPVSFSVLTDEMKKDARNIIGTLHTGNATFRVYILLKTGTDQKEYIHLLKIERRKT